MYFSILRQLGEQFVGLFFHIKQAFFVDLPVDSFAVSQMNGFVEVDLIKESMGARV